MGHSALPKSRAKPLLVRPGARFACFGDGLCCTDVHALGEVRPAEAKRVRTLDASAITRHGGLGLMVLRTTDTRGCVFLGEQGCSVHASHGEMFKPAICRRFPFGLVSTPDGGRVTTDHRCPCRSMGERPPLDTEVAARSLGDAAGRLRVDHASSVTIALHKGSRVPFARYATIERRLFDRLSAATSLREPLDILVSEGGEPLVPLDAIRWQDVAHLYRSHIDGTSCGEALAWFGDTLLSLSGEKIRSRRSRPWAPAFDRAERRSMAPASAASVLSDWAQDVLWSLSWTAHGPLDTALSELATRLLVAVEICRRLIGEGAREDRAAAEAVLIVELAGELPLWESVMAAMRPGQGPAAEPC